MSKVRYKSIQHCQNYHKPCRSYLFLSGLIPDNAVPAGNPHTQKNYRYTLLLSYLLEDHFPHHPSVRSRPMRYPKNSLHFPTVHLNNQKPVLLEGSSHFHKKLSRLRDLCISPSVLYLPRILHPLIPAAMTPCHTDHLTHLLPNLHRLGLCQPIQTHLTSVFLLTEEAHHFSKVQSLPLR